MLKIFGFIISIILIGIITLRIPKESVGLTNFATKNNVLGSPSSTQDSLDVLIVLGIFLFFGIAIQLNLTSR